MTNKSHVSTPTETKHILFFIFIVIIKGRKLRSEWVRFPQVFTESWHHRHGSPTLKSDQEHSLCASHCPRPQYPAVTKQERKRAVPSEGLPSGRKYRCKLQVIIVNVKSVISIEISHFFNPLIPKSGREDCPAFIILTDT